LFKYNIRTTSNLNWVMVMKSSFSKNFPFSTLLSTFFCVPFILSNPGNLFANNAIKGAENFPKNINKQLSIDPNMMDIYLQSRGLKFLKKITVDNDTGYLYEFENKTAMHPDKYNETKRCLILTGEPSSLGYQAGYLRPVYTLKILTEFIQKIGLSQFQILGIKVKQGTPEGDKLWELLTAELKLYAILTDEYIPEYLKTEMEGVITGLQAYAENNWNNDTDREKHEKAMSLSYFDILLLNQGVDNFYFLLAALLNKVPEGWTIPTGEDLEYDPEDTAHIRALDLFIRALAINSGISKKRASEIFTLPEETDINNFFRAGCNEWAVTGDKTENSETFHGRDFMFSTKGIYQDAACVKVYLPDDGNPFIGVDPAGFVGHASAMNSEGISMGVDISQAAAYGHHPGVGCLLILRDTVQYATDIDQAIAHVRSLKRGVPWIYIIADDNSPAYGNSVILECGRSDSMDIEKGYDWRGFMNLHWLRQLWFLYPIMQLPENDIPVDGICERNAKWGFPKALKYLPAIDPDSWDTHPSFGRDNTPYFHRQTEEWDDVVIATNHFIVPEMRFSQFYLPIQLIYGAGPMLESMWRYDFLLNLIEEISASQDEMFFFDKNIDGSYADHPTYGSAGWLINFLNPFWKNKNDEQANIWFYGRDNATEEELFKKEVGGHHIVFNNSTGEMRALFGYMGDPWVGLNIIELFENSQ